MSENLDELLAWAESGESTGGERTHESLKRLVSEVRWYQRRATALQVVQKQMRDPERKMVCDILANGCTYELSAGKQ